MGPAAVGPAPKAATAQQQSLLPQPSLAPQPPLAPQSRLLRSCRPLRNRRSRRGRRRRASVVDGPPKPDGSAGVGDPHTGSRLSQPGPVAARRADTGASQSGAGRQPVSDRQAAPETGKQAPGAKPSRFRLAALRSRPAGPAPALPPGVALKPPAGSGRPRPVRPGHAVTRSSAIPAACGQARRSVRGPARRVVIPAARDRRCPAMDRRPMARPPARPRTWRSLGRYGRPKDCPWLGACRPSVRSPRRSCPTCRRTPRRTSTRRCRAGHSGRSVPRLPRPPRQARRIRPEPLPRRRTRSDAAVQEPRSAAVKNTKQRVRRAHRQRPPARPRRRSRARSAGAPPVEVAHSGLPRRPVPPAAVPPPPASQPHSPGQLRLDRYGQRQPRSGIATCRVGACERRQPGPQSSTRRHRSPRQLPAARRRARSVGGFASCPSRGVSDSARAPVAPERHVSDRRRPRRLPRPPSQLLGPGLLTRPLSRGSGGFDPPGAKRRIPSSRDARRAGRASCLCGRSGIGAAA